jgi:hypothetical protein
MTDDSFAERKVIPFDEGKSKKEKPQRRRYAAGNSKNWPPIYRKYIGNDGSIIWPDQKISGTDANKRFMPKPTTTNAALAILALGIECSFDSFKNRMLVGGNVIGQWAGELSDTAVQMLRVLIQDKFEFDPGKDHTFDAATQLCHQNRFDPVLDYLDGLEWDGVERLNEWFSTYLGTDNTELNRAFGPLVMVAAVRRARVPGTKFDQIVVLESKEGFNKSTMIRLMAGTAQMEKAAGVWMYEIADLSGMKKADVDAVKAFASRTSDRGRPAYGRLVVDQPRRCVWWATTNDKEYLKSQTGNRRFWPVEVLRRIDLEALERDRDQLWAEAAYREAQGESIVLPEHLWEAAALLQEARRETDPWEDTLRDVTGHTERTRDGKLEERIFSADLFEKHLVIMPKDQTSALQKRLGTVMWILKWCGSKLVSINGVQRKGFSRPK